MDFRLDRRALTVRPLACDRRENPQLNYWLGRPPAERVAAVEFLRRQLIGPGARLRRVLRVIERDAFRNDCAACRTKQPADIEALREPGADTE